jgi:hypothetical protein
MTMGLIAPGSSTASTIAQYFFWGVVAAGLGTIGYYIFAPIPHERDNPRLGSGGPRGGSKKRKLPIVKGRSCRFEMKEGPDVTCAGAMLHDPTGKAWPARSVLCGPIRRKLRKASDAELEGAGRHYFGGSYPARVVEIDAPNRSMEGWRYLGEVERIYYTRVGRKNGNVRFQHPFNKPSALATVMKGRGRVRLYRKGRFVRLELPRGSILDSRGYVWP